MAEKDNAGKADEELLKQKYAELRMAAAQIKQLQQQLEAVEEKKQELESAVTSLDELKRAGQNVKMLAPVTDGIFAIATLESGSDLIVNVGSDICVRKTSEEAKQLLQAKLQELTGFQESVLEELNSMTEHANALEQELGRLLQE
ncbi:prefoldin subunit alpha [Candidatus Woesearchaeota archaeon]|nr:prefoldin subunit alpha [Candidatus Woesearchaeota archaeon]